MVNNDFWSLLRWFANDFHSWLRHSWKSLANHLTSDQKSLFTLTHALFFISPQCHLYIEWGPWVLSKYKGHLSRYGDSQVKDKMVGRLSCLVHPGVRDKRWVSEIDLSQPRHEIVFWWRHNGPVTSQLTNPIKWPNYPSELIGIYVHINTHNKESLTQRWRRSKNVQLCLIFLFISIWFESEWMSCLILHHK